MQSKLLSWLLFFGALVAFTTEVAAQGTTPAAPAPVAAENLGRIRAARVVGAVTYTTTADPVAKPLQNGAEIYQGSTVTTAPNSSVVLIFSNGATINVGADSVLDIAEFLQDPFQTDFSPATAAEEPSRSQTRLQLTRGELVGKVVKLNREQGSTFTVGTPVGAAGIRGTTFRIVYRPDGTGRAFFSLTTVEGNVEVTLATGTVATPIEVSDNREVILADIGVQVDASTGVVTMTTPVGTTIVAVDAPTSSTQQVIAAAQQIAQAVANVVIVPPPPPVNPSPPPTAPSEPSTPPAEPPPPPSESLPPTPGPTTPPSRTTPGDGIL